MSDMYIHAKTELCSFIVCIASCYCYRPSDEMLATNTVYSLRNLGTKHRFSDKRVSANGSPTSTSHDVSTSVMWVLLLIPIQRWLLNYIDSNSIFVDFRERSRLSDLTETGCSPDSSVLHTAVKSVLGASLVASPLTPPTPSTVLRRPAPPRRYHSNVSPVKPASHHQPDMSPLPSPHGSLSRSVSKHLPTSVTVSATGAR